MTTQAQEERRRRIREQLGAFEALGYLRWQIKPQGMWSITPNAETGTEMVLNIRQVELYLAGLANGARGRRYLPGEVQRFRENYADAIRTQNGGSSDTEVDALYEACGAASVLLGVNLAEIEEPIRESWRTAIEGEHEHTPDDGDPEDTGQGQCKTCGEQIHLVTSDDGETETWEHYS